ncbi:glycerol-3-phosphate 1-O-acyltransferase [Ancylomarina salipaludis]|uniref:Glycerol-3-phosphate acyltransferase n=2 Tax=Ancylomarina salipaludis TaxID=2501299 RepID=A0A4Q1JMX5_9BACT|nr:glycerol-3-phosphate 1-O-acyltransferase [Ancylomarina salipaludis]
MMSLSHEILFVLFSYLLGAIPMGYLLTKRFAGKNILELGSGNIGSTNVRRIAGKRLSIVTQVLDMLKGLLPIALFMCFDDKASASSNFIYFLAIAAIMGHNFSLFLKFKGGKGVNISLGASLLLAPYSVLISVMVYFLVKWQFKYVSLGSILLGISLPITELIIHGLTSTFYYLCICCFLIIMMHIKNIGRLLKNKELIS